MIQKFFLFLILLFSLSVKVDSLIIKNHLLPIKKDTKQIVTLKQVINHLADLGEDEAMSIELCQYGCFHHTVSRMSVTKESEHYNLILYNTPISEPGCIWNVSYHDSTTYHNIFTFTKMQLVDFQEALFLNKTSQSTSHNVIEITFQGQVYESFENSSSSKLKNFLVSLEAEQCTCEDSKYFRTPEYQYYLIKDKLQSKLDYQPVSPFIEDQYE